jgi:transposase
LLPDATALRLAAWHVDPTVAQITLAVCSTQTAAPCPQCTHPAQHIHSHYERTLADLPWAAYRVRLKRIFPPDIGEMRAISEGYLNSYFIT